MKCQWQTPLAPHPELVEGRYGVDPMHPNWHSHLASFDKLRMTNRGGLHKEFQTPMMRIVGAFQSDLPGTSNATFPSRARI